MHHKVPVRATIILNEYNTVIENKAKHEAIKRTAKNVFPNEISFNFAISVNEYFAEAPSLVSNQITRRTRI